jgi:hypothetical protein
MAIWITGLLRSKEEICSLRSSHNSVIRMEAVYVSLMCNCPQLSLLYQQGSVCYSGVCCTFRPIASEYSLIFVQQITAA